MKKMFIACAVLAAMTLASCGDTKMCYEVTTKITVLGVETSTTSHVFGTSNDLDAYIANVKETQKNMGLSEDAIKISYKKANKSEEDCK